ncbi:MAG: hypothetical protein ACK40A_16135, partial [Pannonibacter indicus]
MVLFLIAGGAGRLHGAAPVTNIFTAVHRAAAKFPACPYTKAFDADASRLENAQAPHGLNQCSMRQA